MEVKNILSIMVVALVGAVILTGFIPVLGATQDNIGDSVTYENPLNDGNYYMRKIADGDTLVVTVASGETTTVYVNGEQIKTIAGDIIGGYHDLIMTNVFTANTGGSTSGLQIASYNSTSVGYTSTTTITYSNGTITQTNDGQTSIEFAGVEWGYIVCNEPDAGFYESVRTGGTPFYIKTNNDIVCGGVYTTGDNDTYYWYKDGVSFVYQDYTTSAEINKTLVAGTTDIYQATITINVGDESFTPYRVLIPLEVTGHQASGALYDVYGLIPLIVAVGLLMFAITAILIRRV